MPKSLSFILLCAMAGCAAGNHGDKKAPEIVGLSSFALAARYGTPASYQHQGEYLQLNYGSAAAGCLLIVLVDQDQRVVGWASAGAACPAR